MRKKGQKQKKKKQKTRTLQKRKLLVLKSSRGNVEPPQSTEEKQYEVQAIVDDKIEPDGQHLYKVRCKGYADLEDTWKPEASLSQALDPLNSYKQQRSRKRPSVSSSRGAKRRKRWLPELVVVYVFTVYS